MTEGVIVSVGALAYMGIGLVLSYLIAAYNPNFNERKGLTLEQFVRFGLVGMVIWPIFLVVLFYENCIEDKNFSEKIVIKYRGK